MQDMGSLVDGQLVCISVVVKKCHTNTCHNWEMEPCHHRYVYEFDFIFHERDCGLGAMNITRISPKRVSDEYLAYGELING
jgi:hypothetical protein